LAKTAHTDEKVFRQLSMSCDEVLQLTNFLHSKRVQFQTGNHMVTWLVHRDFSYNAGLHMSHDPINISRKVSDSFLQKFFSVPFYLDSTFQEKIKVQFTSHTLNQCIFNDLYTNIQSRPSQIACTLSFRSLPKNAFSNGSGAISVEIIGNAVTKPWDLLIVSGLL
jgi:hypothetical protein